MLISQGVHPLCGIKQVWGGKIQAIFLAKCISISKTVRDMSIVNINDLYEVAYVLFGSHQNHWPWM